MRVPTEAEEAGLDYAHYAVARRIRTRPRHARNCCYEAHCEDDQELCLGDAWLDNGAPAVADKRPPLREYTFVKVTGRVLVRTIGGVAARPACAAGDAGQNHASPAQKTPVKTPLKRSASMLSPAGPGSAAGVAPPPAPDVGGVDATTGDSGSEEQASDGDDQGKTDDLSLLDELEKLDDKKDTPKGKTGKRTKK